MPDLSAGSSVGNYVLESRLGDGGFGTVWLARTVGTGDLVAVKLLTGAYSGDTAAMRAEVELLAASAGSRSRHVVKVLDGGVVPTPYVVMEYVEGEDLSHLLRDHGAQSVARTIEIGEAIADALAALSDVGIMHRDVKPANVLMDKSGVIKLGDFGIAKIIGYATVTVAGSSAMTLAYAAPEVWDDSSGAFGSPSHKSDLYALGILLYECLVGTTPFQGTFGSLYAAHRERHPDLAKLPSDTPASLLSLIRRSLAKQPSDRPANAAECVLMLQRARVEMQEAAGSPPSQEPRRFGSWQRGAPHPTIPWAWRCANELGNVATVEVHFARDLEYGTHLRKAIAANVALTPLGAERLIDTNRLILRPTEAWTPDPGRPFTFWIAREELPRASVTLLNLNETRAVAFALHAMIEAAKKHNLKLPVSLDNVSISPGGHVFLHRPGVELERSDPEGDALTLLLGLPLDPASRAVVAQAMSLTELIPATPAQDGTMIQQRPMGDATVMGRPDVDGTIIGRPDVDGTIIGRRPAQGAPSRTCPNCNASVREGLLFCNDCGFKLDAVVQTACPRCSTIVEADATFCPQCGERLSPDIGVPLAGGAPAKADGLSALSVGLLSLDGNRGDYELILNNTGKTMLSLNLSGSDPTRQLYFEMLQDVLIGPGITRRVPVRVSSNWDGWPKGGDLVPFSLYVDGTVNEGSRRLDGEVYVQGTGSSKTDSQTVLMYIACISLGLAAGLGFVLVMLR